METFCMVLRKHTKYGGSNSAKRAWADSSYKHDLFRAPITEPSSHLTFSPAFYRSHDLRTRLSLCKHPQDSSFLEANLTYVYHPINGKPRILLKMENTLQSSVEKNKKQKVKLPKQKMWLNQKMQMHLQQC